MRAATLLPNPLLVRPMLLLAGAYLATHALSLSLIRFSGPLAPAWPPVGIMLAALIVLPASHRALVFVSFALLDTLSNVMQGYATRWSLLYLFVSTGEMLLAAWLLRRLTHGERVRFSRVRDVIALLLATGLATLVGSVPAGAVAVASGAMSWLSSAVIWWVGDMLAFVIFTPLTVLLIDPPAPRTSRRGARWRVLEGATIAIGIAALSTWAFLERDLIGSLMARPYMLSVLVLWATLRFGQVGALLAVLEVAVVGVALLLTNDPRTFGGTDTPSGMIAVQVFVGVTCMVSLVLATAVREQQETAQANADMVAALRASEQRLRQSQKMEAIGQLAGGVAHDFNNVLAAILMQLEELRFVRDLPRAARELLGDVEDSAQRAARLTRQLLVFSRQQAMQQHVSDLNALVRAHVRLLRRVVPTTHTLTIACAPAPLVVNVDEGMIEQVLLNLVLNARDAMPDGGPVVVATAMRELLAPEGELAPGRYAVLTVRDSGTGIPDEHLPRLFEPFFTTKPPGKGTGLGLATVYGIVQQHGGAVRAATEVGRGTTMDVWLPLSDDDALRSAAQHPVVTDEHEVVHTPASIMVVEDEPTVRRLLQRVLEREGYVVHARTSGRDALDQWPDTPVDLVITDLVMPGGVSGTQLARELRQRHPELPLVFTSGYDPEFDPTDVTMVAGENFIPKPATPADILAVVRRNVGGRTT